MQCITAEYKYSVLLDQDFIGEYLLPWNLRYHQLALNICSHVTNQFSSNRPGYSGCVMSDVRLVRYRCLTWSVSVINDAEVNYNLQAFLLLFLSPSFMGYSIGVDYYKVVCTGIFCPLILIN